MTAYFFSDTAALTGRTLRHVTRSMDTIITTVITPVAMMLMFSPSASWRRTPA
jgi:ABC-2 type transport system permease protein